MAVDSGRAKEQGSAAPPDCGGAGAEAYAEVRDRVSALGRELSELAAVKVAKVKLSVTESLFTVASIVFGAVFALAFIATAVVFLFSGIAGWIGAAAGAPWIGSLVAGVAGILVVVVAFLVARAKVKSKLAKKAKDACDA